MHYPNDDKLLPDDTWDIARFDAEELEQLEHDRRELAELVVEAMEKLIEDGGWDPRTGVAGLQQLRHGDRHN